MRCRTIVVILVLFIFVAFVAICLLTAVSVASELTDDEVALVLGVRELPPGIRRGLHDMRRWIADPDRNLDGTLRSGASRRSPPRSKGAVVAEGKTEEEEEGGESSSSKGQAAAASRKGKNLVTGSVLLRVLKSDALTLSQKRDVVAAAVANNPTLDINFSNGFGSSLFIVTGFPETAITIEILQLLLGHPNIDPNGDGTSWSPLKNSLGHHRYHFVNLILEHPRTIPQVHPSGLGCDVVPRANARIFFIIDRSTHRCFTQHPSIYHEGDPAIVDFAKREPMGSVPPSSSGSSAAAAGPNSVDNSPEAKASNQATLRNMMPPLRGGSLVIPPSLFSSFGEGVWFYLVGHTSLAKAGAFAFVSLVHGGLMAAVTFMTLAAAWKARQEKLRQVDQNPLPPQPAQPEAAAE